MKTRLLIFGVMVLGISTGPVVADMTYGDGGASLQGILDGITVGGDSSIDVVTDPLDDVEDAYWSITAQGSASASIIIELAGYAGSNVLGVYDKTNAGNQVVLFDGLADKGDKVTMEIDESGTVIVTYRAYDEDGNYIPGTLRETLSITPFASNAFGFYLETPNGIFYSDTALNGDAADHMVAIQGNDKDMVDLLGNLGDGLWTSSEYVLAWEDLLASNGCDYDYNDMVVMVESVSPVPVPAALMLGMLGMGVAGWRLRRFA